MDENIWVWEERGTVSQRGYEAFHNLYSLTNGRHGVGVGWGTRIAYKEHLAERVVIGKIIL